MVDQPGKERTTYAVITLLRMVSKPVKITKLLKLSSIHKILTLRLPGFLPFPLGVDLDSRPDCSPDDLYNIKASENANYST